MKILQNHKLLVITLILACYVFGTASYGEELSESAKELCKKAAEGNSVLFKATRAEFYDGKNTWTIFGASQSESDSSTKPDKWSVGNAPYQILIVNEAISDTRILPFLDPVPNTNQDTSVRLNAWRGEIEPASLILRSGDQPLSKVQVEASDLSAVGGKDLIGRENVDVRVVKCWYQAGVHLQRRTGDKKRLMPELLLYDADLVRVDYKNHVNLVRDIANLRDAEVLRPFDVPVRTNQQLWITFHVPRNSTPGIYNGTIRIRFIVGNSEMSAIVPVVLNVERMEIPDSLIPFSLFYLARFDPTSRGLNARAKTEKQLEAELRDMRAHGLTNIAVDYEYRKTSTGEPDFSMMIPVLKAMRQAGFDTTRFLFVDWKVGGAHDSQEYSRKMLELKRVANSFKFTEIFVYNKDENEFSDLVSNRATFEITHDLGLKNFVACSLDTAIRMEGLLDVAILHRGSAIKSKFCYGDSDPSCIQISPWAYNGPQAGTETPGRFRKTYGLDLVKDGYRGVCNYAYQSGDCWDDWAEVNWRPHVMAYPTFDTPIPTLQWEGFRKGIDDIRKSSIVKH